MHGLGGVIFKAFLLDIYRNKVHYGRLEYGRETQGKLTELVRSHQES